MGTLIAAFAAFVLSALYLLPLPPGTLPAELAPYRDFVFMALALYIEVETLIRRRRQPATAKPMPEEPQLEKQAPAPKEEPPPAGEALVLLSLLQEKGRFLDFLMEDITAYQDTQVAAASRVVHQGCAAVIKEYLDVAPVHPGKEGDRITVNEASDPNRYRLVGKVLGDPPYSGVVVHRGWKTSKLALPRFTRAVDTAGPNTLSPMEIEVR
jgi:hypothetical protein